MDSITRRKGAYSNKFTIVPLGDYNNMSDAAESPQRSVSMEKRTLILASSLLLAASANVFAEESKGRYFENTVSERETTLPNGTTVVVFNTKQHAISDKPSDPFNNVLGDCMGRMILSAEGNMLSGSGMCFLLDHDGDGLNQAWIFEEAGTSACPDMCGSWRIVDGFGKFKGTTGSGTWARTHVFADGTMGTYESTYTLK